jgi:hypothetical protein
MKFCDLQSLTSHTPLALEVDVTGVLQVPVPAFYGVLHSLSTILDRFNALKGRAPQLKHNRNVSQTGPQDQRTSILNPI